MSIHTRSLGGPGYARELRLGVIPDQLGERANSMGCAIYRGSKAGSVGRNFKRKGKRGKRERLTVWEMDSEVEGA